MQFSLTTKFNFPHIPLLLLNVPFKFIMSPSLLIPHTGMASLASLCI